MNVLKSGHLGEKELRIRGDGVVGTISYTVQPFSITVVSVLAN